MPRWLLSLLFLPPEASEASVGIDALHAFVISVTMACSLGVFVACAWFVARYRRTSADELTPRIEASWRGEGTIVASILALFLLWWVIGYRQYVALVTPPPDATTVYVAAKQWMWKFTYPDGRSANDVLTVAKGRPVRLVMTSRDVIHSFYVSAFRDKQDVLPGRYTTLWFIPTMPGAYPILCAEYCGVSHSMMRGTVVVLDSDDYARWLASTSRDASGETDLASEGARVARRHECLACHTVDGQRHVGPTWAGLYGSEVALEDGRHVQADAAYLTRSMMEPSTDIVAGFKPVMPTFFGVLTPDETGALVEYIASLGGGGAASGVKLPVLGIDPLAVPDSGAPGTGVPVLGETP
jgi:cytochrome c oxidase subunit 2